ncbi:MAG TPA: DUF488 domain-containing protein [Thermoanaerobaculia bacterium]|jgi:uncharacterized protein (DUF488 family)|nr:DUF488 domain-containing protein [Thermoanaerobaculia bacterium]
MPPVYTAGHSTRSIEELIALLAGHGVTTLVDVRRYPASRRHPQFSRDALAASLAGAGIQYVHEPDLGGRRPARPGSPHTAWRVEAFRGYADYMETPQFQAALDRLVQRSREETVAILCAEAVPWRCHRRLISDALVARGIDVLHILGRGRADPHELDPNARILPGGRLLYAGPAGDQPSLFDTATEL